jgi:hypothetical protein
VGVSGFGREGEQVGPQRRPGRFGGESGNVVVGLVELCHGLESNKLFGCDVEAVGVALDRLEEPGRSAIVAVSTGGVSAVCTIAATVARPPSTAAASSSQVARCSARERGSCLASRVSNVAC